MFVAADGDAPTGDMKRMTLVQMLPMEIATYISMHKALPEYKTFDSLKRFVFKYVRTLRSLKRAPRAAHLLEEQPPGPAIRSRGGAGGRGAEGPTFGVR